MLIFSVFEMMKIMEKLDGALNIFEIGINERDRWMEETKIIFVH